MNAKSLAYKLFLLVLIASLLSGCEAIGIATQQPLPTVVLGEDSSTAQAAEQSQGSGVTASGVAVPAKEAKLAFALGGRVETVSVKVGDQVQAGQVLAKLEGSEKLNLAVQTANLEFLSARQALDDLSKDMDVKQAKAWETYLDAGEAYSDTLKARDNLKGQDSSQSYQDALAELDQAQVDVRRLRAYYDSLPGTPQNNPDKAKALLTLKMARLREDAAQTKVDQFSGEANSDELSRAESDLALAQANLDKAKRDFESIQQGPDPQTMELAQARLDTAKAGLQAAESALDDLNLVAPINGTVTELYINASEWANPGQPVMALHDLVNLRVETTDLSERDIPKVSVGQAVQVYVKALDQTVSGRVSSIAPLANTLGGDVVYKTTIELDSAPPGLRAGMNVEVQFK